MYFSYEQERDFNTLLGLTLTDVKAGDAEITFTTSCGKKYVMMHEQDCCEEVYIESVVGDWQDLIGYPILLAEQSVGDTPSDYTFDYEPDSYTWTFYKLATIKGYVDLRWLGHSNGYYSEGVSFYEVP
jgi:hypothetical protein